MDITAAFEAVIGGSNPSGRTTKEIASLKGSPRFARRLIESVEKYQANSFFPAYRQAGGSFLANFALKQRYLCQNSLLFFREYHPFYDEIDSKMTWELFFYTLI